MATDIELLINAKVMGGCNHPSFATERVKEFGRTHELVYCTRCGERELVHQPFGSSDEPTDEALLGQLKARIPRHCADLTMARRTLRRLEELGWRWSVAKRDGVFTFSLQNGGKRVVGRSSPQEHLAICDAVASLAKIL